MIAAMLVTAILSAASASSRASDTALRTIDQALLDAQGSGDRAVWMRAMTPDSVYVDENGIIMSRDAFLEQLKPLPQHVSGIIHITSYRVSHHGNVALVIHTDDERELYHGQRLHADYITTETWYDEAGTWKLALTHVYAVNKVPQAAALPAESLEEYVGCYRAASDLHYRIQLVGGRLTGGVTGRPSHPLLAEVPGVFFVPGQPRIRMIFQRDGNGHITGYVSRREGDDLIWKRDASGVCPR
jgi:ketosteroid isomerase-like protein